MAGSMTFHESFGDVTTEQLRLYKKFNVSQSDHRDLAEAAGGEDKHRAICNLLRQCSSKGFFSAYELQEMREVIGNG